MWSREHDKEHKCDNILCKNSDANSSVPQCLLAWFTRGHHIFNKLKKKESP